MSITLLISQHNDSRRLAYLKKGKVLDFDAEWPSSKVNSLSKTTAFPRLNQIYWGRVIRVDSAHAFVKIDQNQVALLPLEPPFPKPNEGHNLLVQVRREAIPDKGTPDKGTLLTRKITLGGRFCLFHPFQKKSSVSSKIQNPTARHRLQALVDGQEAITLREAAVYATPDQIWEEVATLHQRLRDIEALSSKAPCLTPYDALSPAYRWLRDLDLCEVEAILVDHDDALHDVRVFLKNHRPDLLAFVKKHTRGSVFDAYGLEDIWDSLLSDVVALASGGNIVLDVTAAAVVIDVNQGANGARDTNKEAVPVIVQHLKLRHLGGNIIIDFIGVKPSPQDRQTLKDLIVHSAAAYGFPLEVYGWSKLGWMEARLPKQRLPLREMITLTHQEKTP